MNIWVRSIEVSESQGWWSAFLKRTIDIVFGITVMTVFFPFFALVALAIKIDSRGPFIYKQKRCGKNGREFMMYKFRSMVLDADEIKKLLKNEMDGPMFKVSNDPRITRLGSIMRKWSIDEMPQMINVLKGEMSLVGPRPLADAEMRKNEAWRTARLSVKPGLTGLWQIKGRGSHKFSDWVKYDMEYVQNFSIMMDLKILYHTLGAVLRRKGAE